jgi:hypothetical protein
VIQEVADDAGGGRLPVRPGDSDERKLSGRMPIPRAAKYEGGAATVAYDDFRHRLLLWTLDHDRDRPSADRITYEPVTVRLRATDCEIHHPRGDPPAVYAETAEGGPVGRRGVEQVGAAELIEQVGPGQGHYSAHTAMDVPGGAG